MKRIRKWLPVPALVLAIGMLAGIGVSALQNGRRQAESAGWVAHTHEVIEALDGILLAIGLAESDLRGFGLTRDEGFLEQFEPAIANTWASFERARWLTQTNPSQQDKLRRLEPLLRRRFELLRGFLQGLRAGAPPVIAPEARRLSLEVRRSVTGLISVENELLARRRAILNEATEQLEARSNAAFAGGIALVLAAFGMLLHEVRQRRSAERGLRAEHALVHSIVEGPGDPVFVKDTDGRYLLMNSAGARFMGMTPERVRGQRDDDLLLPESASAIRQRDQAVMSSGEPATYEETTSTTSHTRIHLTTRAPYRDEQGSVVGVVGIARDITERKAQEVARLREMSLLLQLGDLLQACRSVEEAYEVIAQLAPRLFAGESGAVCLFHASRNLLEAHVQWGELSVLGEPATFAPDDCWALRRVQTYFLERVAAGIPCKHLPEDQPQSTLCQPMLAHGEVLGIVHLASTTPLSEEVRRRASMVAEQTSMALANLQLRETLRNQSIRDPLTGLFNRRYTEETLQRELHRAVREGQALAVMMIDVDHFKRFNDSFGHQAGDQVLRDISGLLRTCTRGGDVASRMGGEELLILLPRADLQQAQAKAEQIRERVASLEIKHEGKSIGPVTISIGVAAFPNHGTVPNELLRAADVALYRAKGSGRNCVALSA